VTEVVAQRPGSVRPRWSNTAVALAVSSYEWYLMVHVLMVVVWVGGAHAIQLFAARILKGGDPRRLAAFAKDVDWIGTRIFIPASLLVLIFGFLLVEEGDTGYPFWVVFGLAVFAFTFFSGALFLGPESGRIGKLVDERGPADPEVQRRIKRILVYSRLDLLLLVLVVIAMTIKPFS
jgi:uncharacterized membrane protein